MMINRPLRFFFCAMILSGSIANAQYGNEWISFGQSYYKIPVAKTGIYRLTYNDLQNAGFPVNSVDPRRIQMYYRGVEQSIWVEGQDDAILNTSDFIEFYGKRNDGTLDADLYKPSSAQPHKYYNLYTDTSSYFLTWNLGAVLGKRIVKFKEVNVTGIPAQTSHINQVLNVFASEYSAGNTESSYLQYSHYDEGEGWTGETICTINSGCTGQKDFIVENLNNKFTTAGLPQLEVQLTGRDALDHLAEIYVGVNSGSLRLLATQSFSNFQTPIINAELDWSDVGSDGKMTVRVKGLGVGGERERISVAYIKVSHLQNFNMIGVTERVFRLNVDPTNKSYVVLTSPPAATRIFDITQSENISIIETTTAGSNLTAIVPNTNVSRTLFVSNATMSASIKPVTFRQINGAVPNFIIISHPLLMKPGLGYSDPVKAYGAYRASPEGGGYDTLVVTIQQLYNQFNYGETSPRAIFQFMKYMVATGDPKYLFIIGKGLDVGYDHRLAATPGEVKDLVPAAGYPSSDMLFTAGLDGTTFDPAVATGRIPASTPAEVAAYLNKVKEVDALHFDELWRKEVLHLSGGIQPVELIAFKQYMDGFGEIAQDHFYGGTVKTIAKREPEPVELINIAAEVNKGLNLVTFFGHSSPNTIDIDIGFATDPVMGYNNNGKYPTFLINGCNAGVFFSKSKAFGEDWILAANKGARNFIAHSSFGFTNTLRAYTEMFYQVGFGDSTYITQGIGDIQKEVAKRYLATNGTNISSVTQVQQMMLLGDPSLKLFGAPLPDYEIDNGSLSLESFDEKPVTALTDSFAIRVIVKNYGFANQDLLPVSITRTYNDNTSITYDSLFQSVKTLDTLYFKIKREPGVNGFGNNRFEVYIDHEDVIVELNEGNNQGELNLFIPLSGTRNLFPAPYSIVSTSEISLQWQNTNLLSEERSYLIEIDTINSFDSGYLKQFSQAGKVLNAKNFSLLSKDSLVYYWRTKLANPESGESTEWHMTSFAYINNSQGGWAQIDFAQYLENATTSLIKDKEIEELQYESTEANIVISTFGSSNPAPFTDVSVKINDIEFNLATQGVPCRNNTLNLVAFDKTTMVPYAGIPFKFSDPRTCGREPQLINSFHYSEMETGLGDDLIQYIDNLEVSDSIVLFSIGDAGYASWPANAISKLSEVGIGASQLTSLQTGEPFVIFGKKGAPAGTAQVIRAQGTPVDEQELVVSESLTGRFTTGAMNSTLIGPALSWQQFSAHVIEAEVSDDFSFDIIGVGINESQTELYTAVIGDLDLSEVDAAQYPWLKIIFKTEDEINLTSPQLNQWLVFYVPAPEGLLVYTGNLDTQSKQEGEEYTTSYAFVNISNHVFPDSLTVNVSSFNKISRKSEKQVMKIMAPLPGDSAKFNVGINTIGKVGLNDVNVFVNPHILPEQYYENNTLELLNQLNVLGDKILPVLDVIIDGRHVENGEFISPNPTIVVRVWDENKLILKTDTTGVRILLQYPCEAGCVPENIFFSQSDVSWFAATDTSDFRVVFTPESLPEGDYLLIVEASDASGNPPGASYKIEFKVSEQTTINVSPAFPNPSRGEFFYEVTIGGGVLPDHSIFQVYDLQGKLIYTQEDAASHYRIGKNILTWDGKDNSRSLVNNGLYIYRHIITVNGMQKSTTGRIVLLR